LVGEQPNKKRNGGSDAEAEETTPLDYAEVFTTLSYWYHLPWSEIRSMPYSAIEQYMEKLEKHHAILRMMLGEGAKVPHMEEEHQREWASELEEKIHGGAPPIRIAPRAVLKMIGIGIRK
jgi:hypothetical protein